MMKNFVLAAIAGIGCTNALKLETTSTADLLAATEKKLSLDLKGGAKCMADNGIKNRCCQCTPDNGEEVLIFRP